MIAKGTPDSIKCVAVVCLKWGAPHLRHSLATNLLKKNVAMPIISTVMGHQRTETTSTEFRKPESAANGTESGKPDTPAGEVITEGGTEAGESQKPEAGMRLL